MTSSSAAAAITSSKAKPSCAPRRRARWPGNPMRVSSARGRMFEGTGAADWPNGRAIAGALNANEAGPKARLVEAVRSRSGLPLAGGAASLALRGRKARAIDDARGLLERVGRARLRLRLDGVAVGRVGLVRELALGGGDAGVGDRHAGLGRDEIAGAGHARRVVGGVGVAGLDVRDRVADISLGRGVLALLLLAEERRESDGGEDADDQNDDEELDQGEARLVIAQLAQHFDPPRIKLQLTNQLHSCLRSGSSASSSLRSVALRPTLASGLPLASEGIWPSLRPVHRSRGPRS